MAEYANPTAQLEEEILAGTIEHPANPVLDWQISHCHVHKNKFTKQRRPVKPSDDSGDPRTIDGIAAMVMGLKVEQLEASLKLDFYESNELEVM